ncbi:hypothetical protein [Candidatus Synechococcus spongiarum]|nr:hypothetical protein [Candidatus Synechococcus spongiarum]
MSSVSRRGRPQRWSHGVKRTVPAPGANPDPPGLRGMHRLANRLLLASLLLSTVLCVLELQVRFNMNRTYTALQEARTMQQLYLDSRSQLVAALGTADGAGTREQSDGLAAQGPEPLVLPPPPSRLLKRRPLLASPARWLNAGPVLRGY